MRQEFPFLDVYTLSLPRSAERRRHIATEFAAHGIERYQLVDAVDSDDPRVDTLYYQGKVRRYPPCFRCGQVECDCDNNVMIPAQVATFLTHRKVWAQIASRSDGLYLITEDDLKFNGHYTQAVSFLEATLQAEGLLQDAGPLLLRLGWALDDEHTAGPFKLLPDKIRMSNPAYAINPAMARELIRHSDRIDHTVDVFVHIDVASRWRNYTLFPPLAHELSYSKGEMSSLIRPRGKRLERLQDSDEAEHREELSGYEQHVDRAIRRRLLCIGHPRTGSGYVSALLKAYGIDAGHERMGEDGIVSWMFTVYDWHNPFWLNPYAKSRYTCDFEHVIMHVRDPWTAVPSIMRENAHAALSLDFRARHIRLRYGTDIAAIPSEFEKAVAGYCLWSRLALENNHPELVLRIEEDEKRLRDYLASIGFAMPSGALRLPSKDINSDKAYQGQRPAKPELDAMAWLGLDSHWKQALNSLCEQLGYPPIYSEDLQRLLRSTP